jgi:hypothetical protein
MTKMALSMKKEKTIWLRSVFSPKAVAFSFSAFLISGSRYFSIRSFQNWT